MQLAPPSRDSQPAKPKQYYFYLVLLIVLLLGSQVWRNSVDDSYEHSDGGFFAKVAQEVYLVGEHKGWGEALAFGFFHRHWKPVISQEYLVPFLVISKGDTRLAVDLYLAVMAVLWAIVSLFTCYEITGSPALAFGSALLLAVAPWIVQNSYWYMGELPWNLSVLAYFGFLYASDFLKRGWKWPTFFLILALVTRPVESAIGLLPVFVWLSFKNAKLDKLRKIESVLWMATESAVAFAILAYPHFVTPEREYRPTPLAIIFFAAAIYFAIKIILLKRRDQLNSNNPQVPWTAVFVVCFFWYLPCAETLMNWVSKTTSGPLVVNAAHFRLNRESFLFLFFSSASFFIWTPYLLFLFGKRVRPAIPKTIWLIHLWAGFALAVIGSQTQSRDFRYYELSWIALFLLPLVGAKKPRLVMAVVVGPGLLQAAATFPYALSFSDHRAITRFSWQIRDLAGGASFARRPENNVEFAAFSDFLLTIPAPPDAEVNIVECEQHQRIGRETDQWRLVLKVREQNRFWDFDRFFLYDDVLYTESAFNGKDILIVGPDCDPGSPGAKVVEAIRDCAIQGPKCPISGLTLAGRWRFPVNDGDADQDHLILKTSAFASNGDFLRCYGKFQNYFSL